MNEFSIDLRLERHRLQEEIAALEPAVAAQQARLRLARKKLEAIQTLLVEYEKAPWDQPKEPP